MHVNIRSRAIAIPALLTLALSWSCQRRKSARDLLEGAVEAHGGRTRLATFDNVAVVSTGRFKGTVEFTRRLSYRAPASWRMTVETRGAVVMAFGVDGSQCWRKDRQFVSSCDEGDRKELSRVTSVLTARFLHRIDPATLGESASVEIDGRQAPALTAGDLQLVLDPETRLLRQVRYDENWVETFSDFRTINGAKLGAHRVLSIAGELDVEETWNEIRPGAVQASELSAPPVSAPGIVVDEFEFERPVAWTEVDNLGPAAEEALSALEKFVQARGRHVSSSDGLVLIPIDGQQRWQLAITLEAGSPLEPTQAGALHLETWPAKRVIGVFERGDPAHVLGRKSKLEAELARRGAKPQPDARYQLLCGARCLQTAARERLTLLRIAVQGKASH